MLRKIRMIVIYTADIEPAHTRPFMDVGCLKFQLQEAYLTELDSETIKEKLERKIKSGGDFDGGICRRFLSSEGGAGG